MSRFIHCYNNNSLLCEGARREMKLPPIPNPREIPPSSHLDRVADDWQPNWTEYDMVRRWRPVMRLPYGVAYNREQDFEFLFDRGYIPIWIRRVRNRIKTAMPLNPSGYIPILEDWRGWFYDDAIPHKDRVEIGGRALSHFIVGFDVRPLVKNCDPYRFRNGL